MATFADEIKNIVNGKGNKTAKIQALLKMGLRPNEAEFSYQTYYAGRPITSTFRFAYTFGVEIECLFKRQGTLDSLNAADVPYVYRGSYYHSNGNAQFEFKSDCSIHCDSSAHSPIEMVSPVLKGGKGFDMLKKACKALNDNDARVNKSTGMHVHIGADMLSDEQYVNVFKNYQMLERVIDSFMAKSRRANNNTYCGTLRGHNLAACVTRADVRRELGSRYHKVNAESWLGHKTIEFRQHQGTTDFEKIQNWVTFCAKLIKFSMNSVFDAEIQSVDEIPFLNQKEKDFFNARVAEFAARG